LEQENLGATDNDLKGPNIWTLKKIKEQNRILKQIKGMGGWRALKAGQTD